LDVASGEGRLNVDTVIDTVRTCQCDDFVRVFLLRLDGDSLSS